MSNEWRALTDEEAAWLWDTFQRDEEEDAKLRADMGEAAWAEMIAAINEMHDYFCNGGSLH